MGAEPSHSYCIPSPKNGSSLGPRICYADAGVVALINTSCVYSLDLAASSCFASASMAVFLNRKQILKVIFMYGMAVLSLLQPRSLLVKTVSHPSVSAAVNRNFYHPSW
ncbi:hypothetical protein SUGI_0434600 [Cryptomeria japonica]|nr:hypothetical protein SUGI_0434600 [Cryptomeria japonica]